MTWQCPYNPSELHQVNPHGFDCGHRVVLPDGRLGTVSKTSFKFAWVDADTGTDWKGHLTDLRPAMEGELGQPQIVQLSLLP